MTPNIIFVRVKDSYIYLKNVLRWAKDNPDLKDVLDYPFEELINDLDQSVSLFRPIFEKNKDFILKKIQELSGFKWRDDAPVIYVYPTPFFNSFSHPLFLRVGGIKGGHFVARKIGHMLGTLIHELCHNNFENLPVDRETNEDLINFIVVKILDEIDPRYTKEYVEFHEKIGKKMNIESVPESIKTGELSISDFYSNKKE